MRRAATLLGEILALLALAAGVLWGLARDERALVAGLERTASALAGLPVEIDGVGLSSEPALVLRRIRLGSRATIGRAELSLGRRAHLRLVRPRIELRLPAAAPAGAQPARGWKPTARPSAWLTRRWPVSLHDGRLVLQRGTELGLEVRGVHLDLSAPAVEGVRRVVAGPTRLWFRQEPRLAVASVAVEVDSEGTLRRVAGLGGRVLLPGQAALAIQRVKLSRRAGGYAVDLVGRPAGDRKGQLRASLTLDRGGRPVALVGTLSRVSLAALAPAFEAAGLATGGSGLSGRLTITRTASGPLRFAGELSLSALLVDHPWVAPAPVGPLELAVTAAGTVGQDTLALDRLRLVSAGAALHLAGRLQRAADGSTQFAVELRVPALPCQRLLSSLPRGFAPRLVGMALAGEIGAQGSLQVDSRKLDDTRLELSMRPMSCRVLVDPPGADVRRLRRPTAIRVSGARGEGQRLILGPDNPDYRPLDRISRHLTSAFIVAEDLRFYRHRGFDLYQLKRAFVENLRTGTLVRGASTISQQLVKNAFLQHHRTISRKFQEMVLTWRLEQVLGKRRILELYLNLVEMGPGVHGVERACRHFFGSGADKVTPLQATHLAALTPSPRPLARRFATADPGPAWMERLRLLLRLMRRKGAISRESEQRWSSSRLSLVHRGGATTSQPSAK